MVDWVYPLDPPIVVGSGFNDWRSWGKHAAQDFPAPTGRPVLASRAGIISGTGWYGTGGNTVEIGHDNFLIRSRYMHLSRIDVAPGQAVAQGQCIGLVGNTSTLVLGAHLHFAIWYKLEAMARTVQDDPYATQNWWAVDPLLLINQEDDVALTSQQEFDIAAAGRLARLFEQEFSLTTEPDGKRTMVRRIDAIIWLFSMLFDDSRNDSEADVRRFVRAAKHAERSYAMLFDPADKDQPTDLRRLIYIRNKVN